MEVNVTPVASNKARKRQRITTSWERSQQKQLR